MKVYVVWGNPHEWGEEDWVADICLTKEVAEKVRKEYEEEYPTEDFSIEEYNVKEN